MTLRLNPGLDLAPARERLARTGRAQVANLLHPEDAQALTRALIGLSGWARSIVINGRSADVPAAHFEAQSESEKRRLLQIVWNEAAQGFQFLFDRVRISEMRAAGQTLPAFLTEADDVLNSDGFLAMARDLTGDPDLIYLDCQATRYLPGHFLNQHDDAREGHGRRFAYVLNLAPRWRSDWGGLLQFLSGENGEVEEAFIPHHNHLSVFRVPQWHAVSAVAPFAPEPRLGLTGWMRTVR